uniref:PABS domain-containing protein n=1 Tax=Haemonchus contortus TaxID=6289 RepID=A0A7I4Y3K5_HAECO|nr:Dere\GG21245-PA [Haemonchus contortus]
MSRLRTWLSYLICCSALISLILYVSPSSKTQRLSDPVDEFRKMYLAHFSQRRILENWIPIKGRRYVHIVDRVDFNAKKFSVVRELETDDGTRLSQMRLKLPPVLDADSLDSSEWKINKGGTTSESCLKTMVGEVFVSGTLELRKNVTGDVLIIGLGAGFMNNFLHYHFPELNITVVEIDPKILGIAKKWFALEMDDNHRVDIRDGEMFIREAVHKERRYDVVLVDACDAPGDKKFVCPSAAFRSTAAQRLLSELVKPRGTVIVDLLPFDDPSGKETKWLANEFKRFFDNCMLQKSFGNTILTCSQRLRYEGLTDDFEKFWKKLEE